MEKEEISKRKDYFHLNIDRPMKKNVDLIRYGFLILIACLILSIGISAFGPEKAGTDEKEEWVKDIASVGRIGSLIGFGMFGFGLLSLAFLSKDIHLYLRIAIVIAIGIMLRQLLFF